VYMVQINCFWNRDERYYTKESWHGTKTLDGGTLFTQFSHFIDMLYWLFGGIENMESRFYNFRHQHLTSFEDSGFITFDFITGGCGSLQFTTASWDKNLESSMTVIAQNGSVKVSGQYMDTIEYCHIKNYTLPRLQASSQNNHYYMLNEMVNAIQHKLPTNASDAAHVVGLIEQMYANVKELHPIN
jgi:UDP-N-acetyl-2-amino-2-deoxyglucuronate dehydrogenase